MAAFPTTVATDADLYIAVNALSTQLTDNPLTAGATTANVISTTGFPTVGFISIDSEIIKYTGKTGTSFTGLTRGADGTTAASHVQNSQVFHNVIAAHHNALKDEIEAIETKLYDGASPLFVAETLTSTTNQLILGTTRTVTLSAPTPASASRTWTIPDISGDGTFVSREAAETITGQKTLSASAGNPIHGTNTNDSASAGYIGEVVSSAVGPTDFPSSGTTGDLTSISLTAGDWIVSLFTDLTVNGATITDNRFGVSTTSGNSQAGLTNGDTAGHWGSAIAAVGLVSVGIAGIHIQLASTTTYYFKYFASYSAATPQASGRITAIRIR